MLMVGWSTSSMTFRATSVPCERGIARRRGAGRSTPLAAPFPHRIDDVIIDELHVTRVGHREGLASFAKTKPPRNAFLAAQITPVRRQPAAKTRWFFSTDRWRAYCSPKPHGQQICAALAPTWECAQQAPAVVGFARVWTI
jgi:hypothetical protein